MVIVQALWSSAIDIVSVFVHTIMYCKHQLAPSKVVYVSKQLYNSNTFVNNVCKLHLTDAAHELLI